MNDLNSVFLVGRLTAQPEVTSEKGTVLSFILANHHYSFDEVKKEYVEETGFYTIWLFGNRQIEKWSQTLKKGQRIGVNGRLSKFGDGVGIVAYAIQILDSPPGDQTEQEAPKKARRIKKTA